MQKSSFKRRTINDLGGGGKKNSTATCVCVWGGELNSRLAGGKKTQREFSTRGPPPPDHKWSAPNVIFWQYCNTCRGSSCQLLNKCETALCTSSSKSSSSFFPYFECILLVWIFFQKFMTKHILVIYLWRCSILRLTYTERKKWSRNGSRAEPFPCSPCSQDGPHIGTVLVPLCKVLAFFFSNMIIK